MTEATDTFLDREPSAHQVPADSPANDYPTPIEPLEAVDEPRRATAAEQARTILAGDSVATLASLTSDGSPWASVVQYGVTDNGTPVLSVSRLALHGRNLAADARASIAVAAPVPEGQDPGDSGRVSIAGFVEEPVGEEREAAIAAYYAAVPTAEIYNDFGDFTLYVLRIETVRWVGGFGRMASTSAEVFAAAEPDPVAPHAEFAVKHLNEDHADSLLLMAQAFTGHTDATGATALRADRYGLDLGIVTPRGKTPARVPFAEPIDAPDGLRAATVELAKRARGDDSPSSH
jgi:putative heme iron utilization protein